MKILKIILAIIIIIVESVVLFVSSSLLINFLKYPETYNNLYFGSETMVGGGGWIYRSVVSYLFYNSIMIIISLLLSFFAIRIKKIKFLLLILLLAICQIGCLILL
jgi:hypothetical protein